MDTTEYYRISGIDNLKLGNVPAELKALEQWVAWKAVPVPGKEKPNKVPINPHTGGHAMTNNPSTWGSFEDAVERCRADSLAGIGFVFKEGGGLAGVDLDDCMVENQPNPLAAAFIEKLATYTEVSPSAKGVKAFVRSSAVLGLHEGTTSVDDCIHVLKWEAYAKGRWFAVTGHRIGETTTLAERSDELGRLTAKAVRKFANPKRAHAVPAITIGGENNPVEEDTLRAALSHITPEDEPIWHRIGCCLKAWGAVPGVGDIRARRLWDEWSRKSSKCDPSTQDERWSRMNTEGIGVGTLIMMARENGYESGTAMRMDGTTYVPRKSPHRAGRQSTETGRGKPTVELPNLGGWTRVTVDDCAARMAAAMAGDLYSKGGVPVTLKGDRLAEVKPEWCQGGFGRHAAVVVARQDRKGISVVPTNPTLAHAKAIVSSPSFSGPEVTVVSTCPIISGPRGRLSIVRDGHDPHTGVLVAGGDAADVPLDEAVRLLDEVLEGFDFTTPGDRSRGIAALVTPAMVHGGLLCGRAPVDLGEADNSQAGKGYRAKIVAAVYQSELRTVAFRTGGVGSVEESFCNVLMDGAGFVCLDNVRGKVNSQVIESALTETYLDARSPHRRNMQVDMTRVVVMMTSNDAQMTKDLANRCSPVRIRKRQPGYVFRAYPEGDLLAHIRASRGLYLGAVFAIAKAWDAAGRPSTGESRHDFRAWAGTLDWIVRELFHAAPLCDGLPEARQRMSTPHLGWTREVALLVDQAGSHGVELRVNQIVRILEDAGAGIPGVAEGETLEDDVVFRRACQGVGRQLGRAFGTAHEITLDAYSVVRLEAGTGDNGRPIWAYSFSRTVQEGRQETNQEVQETNGQWQGVKAVLFPIDEAVPPDGPPERPPEKPPEKTLISPESPDTFLYQQCMTKSGASLVVCMESNGVSGGSGGPGGVAAPLGRGSLSGIFGDTAHSREPFGMADENEWQGVVSMKADSKPMPMEKEAP